MKISLAFEERASQNKRCRFQLYIQSSTEGMTLDAEREDKQGQGQGGKVETLGILPNSSITPTDCSFHPFTRICIDLGPYAFFLLVLLRGSKLCIFILLLEGNLAIANKVRREGIRCRRSAKQSQGL